MDERYKLPSVGDRWKLGAQIEQTLGWVIHWQFRPGRRIYTDRPEEFADRLVRHQAKKEKR